MSIYDKKKPRYVREWYIRLRTRMKEMAEEKKKQDEDDKAAEAEYIAEAKKKGMDIKRDEFDSDHEEEEDKDSLDDPQKDWDDHLAAEIDFSDEDELTQLGQYTKPIMHQPTKKIKGGTQNFDTKLKYNFLDEQQVKGLNPMVERARTMKSHKNYMDEISGHAKY